MKNLKTNKVIVALTIILAIVLGLTVSSFAEDEIQAINPSDVIGGNTNSEQNNTNNNVNANKNVNAPVINNTNTSSYNNNTNLPQTGLEDYSTLFVVAGVLFVVAAVAFKKANDYKDI